MKFIQHFGSNFIFGGKKGFSFLSFLFPSRGLLEQDSYFRNSQNVFLLILRTYWLWTRLGKWRGNFIVCGKLIEISMSDRTRLEYCSCVALLKKTSLLYRGKWRAVNFPPSRLKNDDNKNFQSFDSLQLTCQL